MNLICKTSTCNCLNIYKVSLNEGPITMSIRTSCHMLQHSCCIIALFNVVYWIFLHLSYQSKNVLPFAMAPALVITKLVFIVQFHTSQVLWFWQWNHNFTLTILFLTHFNENNSRKQIMYYGFMNKSVEPLVCVLVVPILMLATWNSV